MICHKGHRVTDRLSDLVRKLTQMYDFGIKDFKFLPSFSLSLLVIACPDTHRQTHFQSTDLAQNLIDIYNYGIKGGPTLSINSVALVVFLSYHAPPRRQSDIFPKMLFQTQGGQKLGRSWISGVEFFLQLLPFTLYTRIQRKNRFFTSYTRK